MAGNSSFSLLLIFSLLSISSIVCYGQHNYMDALRKSILFFEGQRSGKLPPDQRLRWRRHSALTDGHTVGVSSSFFSVLECFRLSNILQLFILSSIKFDIYFMQYDMLNGRKSRKKKSIKLSHDVWLINYNCFQMFKYSKCLVNNILIQNTYWTQGSGIDNRLIVSDFSFVAV